MPFCTACGRQNPDDARFCSQCGNRRRCHFVATGQPVCPHPHLAEAGKQVVVLVELKARYVDRGSGSFAFGSILSDRV
mgnify:CR=1 FL=1